MKKKKSKCAENGHSKLEITRKIKKIKLFTVSLDNFNFDYFSEIVPRRDAAILCEMHTDISVNKQTIAYTRKCPRPRGHFLKKRFYKHGSLHNRNMPHNYQSKLQKV